MKREDLVDFTDEQKDLVMSLYGKAITKKDKEIETLKSNKEELENKVATYETKINEFNESAKDNADWKTKFEELQTSIKEQEAKKKAEEDDKILTNNIVEAFGDKVFVNEYTKNAIIGDIKNALKDVNNSGKSAKDLFEEITKDKSDIFANPNKMQDMEGMGDSEQTNVKETPVMW